MFALAFFDAPNGRLLLSRDPAGIKPLYIACTNESLVFASEARTLIATGIVSNAIDRRGLAGFLAYGAAQQPYTLFRDIQSIPAGTSVEVNIRPGERLETGCQAPLALPSPESSHNRGRSDRSGREHLRRRGSRPSH